MDTERTQATINPEAWAAAQVEAVALGLETQPETKPKRKRRDESEKVRGVFFRARTGGEVVGPKSKRGESQRGEWWVCWFDGDGQKRREKAGTKADAVALYQRRKTEVRQGRHFPESMRAKVRVTVGGICDDYTAALEANGRDLRGQAKIRLTEVVDLLGNRDAKGITAQDIERLKARLSQTSARGRKDPADPEKERPRKPASVNRYLQDFRAAFNLARRNGKVDKNPVADVRLLRENNKRVREMGADEEKAILAALDPSQRRTKSGAQDKRFRTDLRPMVRFLTATGLRLGEACNLRCSDVDWRAEVATLAKTKAGKTQHIPLSGEALAILRELRADEGEGFVFVWADGRPWAPGYVTHAFGAAVEAAGVKDLHVHDLRHTFACRLLRGGVDIYTVSKLLRHASVVMSERYAHLSGADLRAAVNRASDTTSDTTKTGGS